MHSRTDKWMARAGTDGRRWRISEEYNIIVEDVARPIFWTVNWYSMRYFTFHRQHRHTGSQTTLTNENLKNEIAFSHPLHAIHLCKKMDDGKGKMELDKIFMIGESYLLCGNGTYTNEYIACLCDRLSIASFHVNMREDRRCPHCCCRILMRSETILTARNVWYIYVCRIGWSIWRFLVCTIHMLCL